MINKKKGSLIGDIISFGFIILYDYIKAVTKGLGRISLDTRKQKILTSMWVAFQILLTYQILFGDKWKLTVYAYPLWLINLLLPNILFYEDKPDNHVFNFDDDED